MKEENKVSRKSQTLVKEMAGYGELFQEISLLIESGRKVAVRQVNTTLVMTYWLMGKQIMDHEQKGKIRAEYGDALLRTLATDLTKRYGKGFSYVNLSLMRQFYNSYPTAGIIQTPSEQSLSVGKEGDYQIFLEKIAKNLPLSWSHYCLLLRMDDSYKRSFYETLSRRNVWSVRQLDREINALLYERTALSKRKDLVIGRACKDPIIVKPEDEIKDSYVLDFLALKNDYSETELEDAMIRHMEQFLLELGYGFSFVARQKRFYLEGDEFRIDLILYHIPLARYVILELKTTRFEHSFAGQMNFYLNWAKENLLPIAQNDPLGIILCSDKNSTCVKYATGGMSSSIFVAKYQTQLPKPEDLQKELERGRQLFLQNLNYQKLNSK